jgi:quercetin dioxygenase-like cupin family protein
MSHRVRHRGAGEGTELAAPDAVLTIKIDSADTDGGYELFEVDAPRGPATPPHQTGWAKAYYLLHGRMIVQVEDQAVDLTPGSAITIPPNAWHTFTVLSPSAGFLVISLTGAMSRFHADLAAAVPADQPVTEPGPELAAVLARHGVRLAPAETGGGGAPC